MTKRSQYLYQIPGTIFLRQIRQTSPSSKYANQAYYKLTIRQPDQTKKTLQVFQTKLANPAIWETIQQKQYSQKQYLFACQNIRGFYHLIDWQEIKEGEQ